MSEVFITISLFAVVSLGRSHHAPRDGALHQYRLSAWSDVRRPTTSIRATSFVTAERDGYEMERDSALQILATQCVRCHQGAEPKGGLDLTTLNGILRGGDNGSAIQVGDPDESLLIKRVTEGSMPPIADGEQLRSADVEILRTWIQSGAAWHADRPLQPPAMQEKQLPPRTEDFSCLRPQEKTVPLPRRSRPCGGCHRGAIHLRLRMKNS